MRFAPIAGTAAEDKPDDSAAPLMPPLADFDRKDLVVLAVPLDGDDTALARERRLRHRYAVWAALDTLGYKATDGGHLNVVHHEPSVCIDGESGRPPRVIFETAQRNELNVSPFSAGAKAESCLEAENPATCRIRRADQIMVLWTEDSFFGTRNEPFACIDALVDSLGGPTQDKRITRVIGPNSSDALTTVDSGIRHYRFAASQSPRFYSPMATADEVFLGTTSALVERTIATDLELTRLLVDELHNRGINVWGRPAPVSSAGGEPDSDDHPAERVLLLSEYDTVYGRALPLSFAVSVLTEDPEALDCDPKCRDARQEQVTDTLETLTEDRLAWRTRLPEVIRVSYLRGLDGQTYRNVPPTGSCTARTRMRRTMTNRS